MERFLKESFVKDVDSDGITALDVEEGELDDLSRATLPLGKVRHLPQAAVVGVVVGYSS